MNERELEVRLRAALEHAAPDDLDSVLARCGAQQRGEVIPMPRRKSGPMRRIAPWAAAACLVLAAAGGYFGARYQQANTVASVVSLDVNPSVRLEVNRAEKVLAAEPVNGDAWEILDGMDLKGTDLKVAVNAIVGSLLKHGYVDELANSVLVSVEDTDAARGEALEVKLTGEIAQVLESASIHGAILSQSFSGDESLQRQAEAYGISLGKAALIQTLVENSSHLTFDGLAGLSINELNLLLNSTAVQDQPAQAGTGETVAEQSAITSTGSASQSGYIGLEAARDIALTHAGLTMDGVGWVEADYDYEDGRMVYEVEFGAAGVEYEYDVDAATGEILKMEREGGSPAGAQTGSQGGAQTGSQGGTQTGSQGGTQTGSQGGTQTGSQGGTQTGSQTGAIGQQAARDIALAHAGAELSQVWELEVDSELDEDEPHYQVEFKTGGYEYEYEIDAFTGAILEWEKDWDD